MALQDSHKGFIDALINHLLDFSINANELRNQLSALKEALHPEITVDEKNEFSQLQRLLIDPIRFLHNLDKQSTTLITVAEVKTYILHRIKQAVNEAMEETDEVFEPLNWQEIKMRIITPENWLTRFVTKALPIDSGDHPYIINEKGKVFTANIVLDQEACIINFDVTLKNSIEPPTRQFWRTFPSNPDNLDRVITSGLSRIRKEAMLIAKQKILDGLEIRKIIDKKSKNHALNSESFDEILTDEFYLDLIERKKLKITDIIKYDKRRNIIELSREEIENSRLSIAQNYLSKELITFNTLKRYGRLLTIYHPQIQNKEIRLAEIINTTNDQKKMLIYPAIIHLIKTRKISLSQAKNLPLYTKEIFNSALYGEFLTKQPINWDNFCLFEEEKCQLLLHKNIENLLKKNVIELSDALSLSLEQLRIICTNYFFLYQWIEKGIIDVYEISNDLEKIYASTYAVRLQAVYIGQSFSCNGQSESLDDLLDEISSAATDINIHEEDLAESILTHFLPIFLMAIKQELEDVMINANKDTCIICEGFLKAMENLPNKYDMGIDNLEKIITSATMLNKKLESIINKKHLLSVSENKKTSVPNLIFNLFPNKKRKHQDNTLEDIQKLCSKIIAFGQFNKFVPKRHSYRY